MSKLLVCGKNSVLDAITNNWPIKKVWLQNNKNEELLIEKGIKYQIVDKQTLDLLTCENHQGFIAELSEFNYSNYDELINDKPNLILILDHIQDPHNFGAIIRTANAAGVKHVIIPKDRSVEVNSTALKTSSGGFINMKIFRVNSIQSTIEKLKKDGFWIYVSALEQNSISYSEIQYNTPTALVVGNEGSGSSKTTLKQADHLVHINQFGTVQSLNVSVATGILLFEIIKKQNE
ncbi:23S rRNA (guanosine(2251)-2'-O)-methyltransferase RlmB [Mycoplasmopsis anatis]|uniref:23S rRNA (guanosine(2251)-2'-O)-methyltransferase RlmB n=1 Tax=Mycoplasmopsis anatis TaxID=171279 RepID=UPI001C4F951D|nr:23S rRNA (guanosine(2251)-2'-O)-methyltransferase RlmB [Mycoplasmopsis anatis]